MRASPSGPPALVRWTPQLVALLVISVGLWAVMLDRATGVAHAHMGGMGATTRMGGTMGLSVWSFAGMWALMMAAMMLPSVAPLAVLYSRTFRRWRTVRLVVFTLSYLAAWTVSALPAWLVLRAVDTQVVTTFRGTVVASLVFAAVGTWQLSPLKERCLRHCRSPLAQLLHYGSFTGRLRDVRVAWHHASYCVGCCWGLMALFVVTGAMHVGAMVALTAIVAAEKLLPRGRELGLATGVAALLAAVVVWWAPGVAPGLI